MLVSLWGLQHAPVSGVFAAPERFVSFIIKAKVNFFRLAHSGAPAPGPTLAARCFACALAGKLIIF